MRKKVEKNTTAKKTVEKKAVSAVKAVESEAKAEAQPEVKAAEAASEVKPEVKEAETTSEEKPEVKAEDKAAAKKTTKTAAAKKTTKTAAKKETEAKPAKTTKATKAAASSQKIVLQMSGREDLSMESIIERVKKAYADEGHSAASIKNVEVYIKPEEGMAYYVIDGYASGISL